MQNTKMLKILIAVIAFLEIPVLCLPYIENYSSFQVVQLCFSEIDESWGTEYILEFMVPVALSVIAGIIILIKANMGTGIVSLALNLIAGFMYAYGASYFNERGIYTAVGLNINRILVVAEIILLIVLIVGIVQKRKQGEVSETL